MSTLAKPFRLPRLRLRLGLIVHIAIALIFVLLVNLLAARKPQVRDLTATQDLSLSESSVNVLRNLQRNVRVVVAVRRNHPLYDRVYDLVAAADRIANERINLDTIDPIREPAKATTLVERINAQLDQRRKDSEVPPFTLEGDQLLLLSGDSIQQIPVEDMILEESLPEGGTTRLFRGEQLFTAALLAATQPEPDLVGLVTGLGEAPNGLAGPGMIAATLPWQNAQLESLDLNSIEAIPPRIKALVFYGPQDDLSEHGAQLLLDYWKAQRGGLLFLLQPGFSQNQPRLLAVARAHGIFPQNDRVLRVRSDLGSSRIDANLSAPLSPVAPWNPEWQRLQRANLNESALIQAATRLANSPNQIAVSLPPQSLSLKLDEELLRDPERGAQGRARLTPLLDSPEGYWGETDPAQNPPTLDPAQDHLGPLTLAAALDLDPKAAQEGKRSARLVVLGNASLLGQEATPQASFDFVMNALNWVMAREELLGIAPKRPEMFSFKLDNAANQRIQLVYLGLFPAILLGIALLVQQARRK